MLWAHCERGAVVSLPVAFGRVPSGPKQVMGDLRTPEGDYRIAGPARPSRFHRFLPLDYPSLADADAALYAGEITWGEHRRIWEAHRQGNLPPSDTPLGGMIGIHGEGKRWKGDSRYLDWTLGCIALRDRDIDFLAERVEIGTPVSIVGRSEGAAEPPWETD